jgi:hypothetical protein
MQDNQDLKDFLIYAAENGYAKDGVQKVQQPDGSITITLTKGDWRLEDNYFSPPDRHSHHGREVVFKDGLPVWYVGYSGFFDKQANVDETLNFLKRAMLRPDPSFPVRGPMTEFLDGGWRYIYEEVEPGGNMDGFYTRETISKDGKQMYRGAFYGGRLI